MFVNSPLTVNQSEWKVKIVTQSDWLPGTTNPLPVSVEVTSAKLFSSPRYFLQGEGQGLA